MIKNKRFLLVATVLAASFLLPAVASAVPQLNQAGVRLGRLGISATTGNDLLVTFKLKTTPTSVAKIKVTFASAFTITTGTPTPATTGFPNTPASIAVPPGTLTSVATAGSKDIVVSGLTSASLNNTSLYGFIIPAGTVQNPSSAGQYSVTVESLTSGNAQIDLTTAATYIYGASANNDQVTVNASVAPSFSFSLSANSDTIPQADPSALQTSTGVTMLVSTNAPLGYTGYVKSANGNLTSANASATIPTGTFDGSPDLLTPVGTIKMYTFVPSSGTVCVTACGGSLTYDGEYNAIDASHGGAFNGTSFASFVSRSGYTGGDNIILKERVGVTSTTPAATDYTDTLTIVAAGNF